MNDRRDEEQNRLSARAARYVRVGTNVGAVAARVASQRLFGLDSSDSKNAAVESPIFIGGGNSNKPGSPHHAAFRYTL